MHAHSALSPAFGQADLSNCEREQIHLAGSIQPHGAMLLVRDTDNTVVQSSSNAASFLNLKGHVLGLRLEQIPGDLAERVRPYLTNQLDTIPLAVRCHIGDPAEPFDGLLHRPPGGGLIIELERAGPPYDFKQQLGQALAKIGMAPSLRALCEETATIFKNVSGYDRVMVYRFDDQGHGEVFSERREPQLEAFLGNRYPATDIPQIARRLYERNRIRVLVDVESTPAQLVPSVSPVTGRELDMSLCFLRTMSPIHIQYLKNMGVCATMVASLVVGGKLWGLVACHHYEPRFIHFASRAACEVLAEAVSTRIAALESYTQSQAELSVRRLEQRLIEAISKDGDWRLALFESPQALLQPLGASGAALLLEGQVFSAGEVPGTHELRDIGAWLDAGNGAQLINTNSLVADAPDLAALTPVASGVVAVRLSSLPSEYLLWFRPERVRTVTWGGDPMKAVVIGDDPSDLSPRRSFAQWHQVVEGTCEPWTPADLTAARMIGDTLADVILQFRSVRMLIGQDQLDQVRRQIQVSGNPVVIADYRGRILVANQAFMALLKAAPPALRELHDLQVLFAETGQSAPSLSELVKQRRAWRGELQLRNDVGEPRPLLVRADPVFSSPERVLGYVLLFTDVTERNAAERARQRFQQEILDQHDGMKVRLDSPADLVFQNLLDPIVENAQIAALEIADGMDTADIPQVLESVRTSVNRAAELLEHLVLHASSTTPDSKA